LNADLALDWDCYSVAKINLVPVALPFETVLSNQVFAVRLAMRRLHQDGHRRVGLVVAEHDEIHNRNLFSAGYHIGQRHLPEEERVPPLICPPMPYPEMAGRIHEWALEYGLDALLSNWNSFGPVAQELGREQGHSCRFVPL